MLKQLYRLFSLPTLKQRLRFWVVLPILALGLLIAVALAWTESYYQEREVRDQLNEAISLQRVFIEKWMDERSKQVRFFARQFSGRKIDEAEMRSMFADFLKVQNDFGAMAYADANGRISVDSSGTLKGADLSERDYFQQAKQGNDYVTDVMIGKTVIKPIVIFSSPVYGEDGKFNGLICGSVSFGTIEKIMRQFTFGRTGETYLLAADGRMLTGPRGAVGPIDYQLHHGTQIYLAAREGRQLTSSYINYSGKAVFGAYQWTRDHRWILVGEINRSEVFQPLYRNVGMICGIVLLLLLLSYYPVMTVAERIERPIRFLLVATKLMRDGNYDYRISKEDMRSAPLELQQLCGMFNTTAQRLKSTIQMLEQTAVVDQLTEVYNRRFIMNEGSKMLEACIRAGQPCSVLMIDMDYFKRVNDTHGHLVGDRVIIHAASILMSCIRNCDLVSRYGGEEFLILAPNTDAEQCAAQIGERIRRRFEEQPYREDEIEVKLTVSIGVADCRQNVAFGTTLLEDMISRADEALYRAKRAGRNRVEL